MNGYRQTLRRLAVRDDRLIDTILGCESRGATPPGLDPRSLALVRLGALIAVDAAPASYLEAVDAARTAGATDDEIVGSLVSVVTLIGVPRAVSAAPKLSLAVGYDVDAGLERFEDE